MSNISIKLKVYSKNQMKTMSLALLINRILTIKTNSIEPKALLIKKKIWI